MLMDNMQPGQVISPLTDSPSPQGDAPEPVRPPESVPESTPTPLAEPAYPAQQSAVAPSQPQQQPALEQQPPAPSPAASFYTGDAATQDNWEQQYQAPSTTQTATEELTWSTSEFIDHEKSLGWFLALALGAVLVTAIVYLLTKDKISTVTVLLVAIIFGAFAARKPHEQHYRLNHNGILVGTMTYGFHSFKAFSTTEEGQNTTVVLQPMKRFMPALTVYVPHDQEDAVVGLLSNYLPVEQHKADALETLLRRIHF